MRMYMIREIEWQSYYYQYENSWGCQETGSWWFTFRAALAVLRNLRGRKAQIETFELIPVEKIRKFVQTHWLRTPIDDIEIMVVNEHAYNISGICLGTIYQLEQKGLEPIEQEKS